MNWHIIKVLVSKDFTLYFRNRFFAIITVLGLVFYIVFYFVMPRSVDESLEIGLYAPAALPAFGQIEEEGLKIDVVETEEALKEAVVEGNYVAGIVLPGDIIEKFMSGQKPGVRVYFTSDVPVEIKNAVAAMIREVAYRMAGQPLTVEVSEEILGTDMVGMQIPPRDRMRPLLAVFIIMAETFGLANLISEEVERGTIQALLVTPVTVKDLFTAKGITGISLAFGEGALLMAIIGGMNRQPLEILVALLLGAILVTGVGFLIASLGKDFMTVLAWGVIAFVILSIPAFGVVFPGTVTDWVKAVPSYYLVDTVHRASNFSSGWGDVWLNLLVLLGFDIVLVWIGIVALRRRSQ